MTTFFKLAQYTDQNTNYESFFFNVRISLFDVGQAEQLF